MREANRQPTRRAPLTDKQSTGRAPLGNRQSARPAPLRKRRQKLSFLWLNPGFILLAIALNLIWVVNNVAPLSNGIWLDTRYEVSGSPTISADFINQVLAFYGSPASGSGQALYDLGAQYGIDPVYALAFFMHESSFGTTGVARVTHSLGNIRATPGYRSYDGYRTYKTWKDGFVDWYKLIRDQYVRKWKLTTIDQIVPVYAPSSDHNDVTAYLQSIKSAVTAWRLGQVQV